MLDFMYTDDIVLLVPSIETDAYGQPTYTEKTIKGCLQSKSKQVTDSNGNLTVTNNLLCTNEPITLANRIRIDGNDRDIVAVDKIVNHLMGNISHYEARF